MFSASPAAAGARLKRLRLRPMMKLASWPVHRVFHGMGRACDILVCASQRPVFVRSVAKIDALVSRVLLLFDSPPPGSHELPISDRPVERLYIQLDLKRIGLLVLAVVAAGAVLFATLEVLAMAGFITRYDQYVVILRKYVRFLQGLLQVVSKFRGFYSNVKWHLAEAARMRQEAAKKQHPPRATRLKLPPFGCRAAYPNTTASRDGYMLVCSTNKQGKWHC